MADRARKLSMVAQYVSVLLDLEDQSVKSTRMTAIQTRVSTEDSVLMELTVSHVNAPKTHLGLESFAMKVIVSIYNCSDENMACWGRGCNAFLKSLKLSLCKDTQNLK